MKSEQTEWRVVLSGSQRDLTLLTKHAVASRWSIEDEDDEYHLVSPDFETLADAESVCDRAQLLLTALNAIGRHCSNQFKGVYCQGVMRPLGDGTHYVAVWADTVRVVVEAEPTTITTGGSVPTSPSVPEAPFPEIAATLVDDPDVAVVLREFGNSSNKWTERLWKVYEAIRHDVGGHSALINDLRWMTEDESHQFRQGVNEPRASGEDARHAVSRRELRADYMRRQEAEDFVKTLLERWLRHKYQHLDK